MTLRTALHCLLLATVLALPVVSFADPPPLTPIQELINRLNSILTAVIPFIVGLAVFVVVWGIFTYITQAGDEEKRKEARQFILWGIIGIFCMVSIWGFVNILVGTFTLDKTIDPVDIPTVPPLAP